MRYVVGADIGHAALQEMVEILRGAGGGGEDDAGLVRGAVFFINMALWGPRRVPTLKVSFLAVLPAFLKVCVAMFRLLNFLSVCYFSFRFDPTECSVL